jgi:tetratricopeptide (TPR) repeat protein
MKPFIFMLAIMVSLGISLAQSQKPGSKPADKNSQAAPATQAAPTPPPPVPGTKPQPQAKTQEEWQAFQQATAKKDPVALEAAANDFAAKFPQSELRSSVYYLAMLFYQQANNGEKEAEMGRKVIELDPGNPVALASLATNTAERTRTTDLDRDERLKEATVQAERALKTVDTDLTVPPGTSLEQVQTYKNMIRSMAYAALGQIQYVKENFAGAETNLRNAVQLTPDPFTMLRLAVVLDKQKKYPEALTIVDRILQTSQPGSLEATKAKQERDRLVKLTGGTPTPTTPVTTAPPAANAPAPGPPAPK